MEPFTAIGTASALTSLIGVLGKVIDTFSELRERWQDADLVLLTLEARLIAMRAALGEIERWTATLTEAPHHQLTMDLDRCLACCRVLIDRMDVELAKIVDPNDTCTNGLGAISKLKLVFNTKGLQGVQSMLESQTNVLTLVLAACNSNTLAEQNSVLLKPQSRKVLKRMEDDAASIAVLRDVDSLFSGNLGTTIRSSKRSLIFDFDGELFRSRIYQTWIRGSVKNSLLKQQGSSLEEWLRSQAIDRRLQQEARENYGYKILVQSLYSRPNCKTAFLQNLASLYPPKDLFVPESSRRMIRDSLLSDGKWIGQKAISAGMGIGDPSILSLATFLVGYSGDTPDLEFARAFSSLWANTRVQGLVTDVWYDSQVLSYLATAAERICAVDYEPTFADTLLLDFPSVRKIPLNFNDPGLLPLTLYDVNGRLAEQKRLHHQFEDADAILFLFDLTEYDQPLIHDKDGDALNEALRQFDMMVNSTAFQSVRVIVIFCNEAGFQHKQLYSPFPRFCPDYQGGLLDFPAMMAYLYAKFEALYRNGHSSLRRYTDIQFLRVDVFDQGSVRPAMEQLARELKSDTDRVARDVATPP